MTLTVLERTATEDLRAFLGAEYADPDDFASAEHLAFYDSHHSEIVASGWMGAGKSRVLTEKAWNVARTYPGVTVALFRKAQNSIAHTTERTFERDVLDRRYLAKRNKTEHYWELTNGARIYFLGLDPDPITGVPSKVGSMDLGWAGVDEAVELTEEDWIMLLGRLRDPRMPWHQLAAATNPGPPKHWLRMRMLANPEQRLMLTIRANKFLTPEYVAMLANLPDTAAGRRLGRGEWAAAEGVIWTLPGDQVRSEPGPWKRVEAGIDWGFVHAFACEVAGQSGSGRLAIIDEIYEQGLTIDQIIPILTIIAHKHGVSTFWADPSEPGYILQCQRAGLPVEAAHNAVSPGIDAVSTAIARGMTVDPACRGLLGEIPGYTWAPNKAGGFHERPIEINDDACDALRYGVVGITRSLEDNPWAALAGQRVGGVG
jgi:PBSX family phage terminase large subunit